MIVARRPRFLARASPHETSYVGDLLRRETVGGAIALAAAVVALGWANLDGSSYDAVRSLRLGPLDVEHWASDGGLTLFFFLAGLELKRELILGSLRRPADAAVPVVAACCGVAVPALVFLAVNHGTANLRGWAVPAATDIAFALAVLAVVGSALPGQLRAFLLTLAVVDDLIVIVIIALFYSHSLRPVGLAVAAVALAAYALLQWRRRGHVLLSVPLAGLAWWGVHHSGVHATIAGVALGLLTRVVPDESEERSPAERLELRLGPLSSGVAVPFFALTAVGVPLQGGLRLLADPLVLGITLGLLLGKPIGVLGGSVLVTRLSGAELAEEIGWRDLFGVAVLAGVGFTVSLLVADLAFVGTAREDAKAAVLIGSTAAGLLAAALLRRRDRRHRAAAL